ncbi:MAG: transglycosylase domain-containing protein [Egibacteraceae bacterium]
MIFTLLVLPVAVLGFAGAVLFFSFVHSVPLPSTIGSKPTVILDSTGTVTFATLQAEFAREEVSLTKLCQPGRRYVCDAVLAAEDAGFYEHSGVSIPGVIRAGIRNVLQGQVTQGGSTITQQYIKNVTGKDERTALRKIREAALAMKLEREYSKDQILELYLNSIYFGRGAYGIQAAAQAYFDVDAPDLTLAQAAQLAGVIPAPSAYDPIENPEDAHRRYRYVLDRMLDLGLVDPVQAGQLQANPPQPQSREDVRFNDAPYFLDIVRRELETKLGDQIYTGLRVTTTLNLTVQRHAQEAYDQAFKAIGPTGALVALDPATGGIVGLVGGENYQTDQFNLALAPRQAGSTFKPFTLAAWIDDRKSPESYFDAPAKVVLPGADNGADWTVNNYEGAKFPPMSLRQATWNSVNTVYAQVQDKVGPRQTAGIASRMMGLRSTEGFRPLASLVLGTAEITPLKLAEAYNTFASGGIHRSAFAVVEARQGGKVVYRHERDSRRVLTAQVANAVTDVLEGVIAKGTGRRAKIGRTAAGKTGTTQEYGDAWFAGYVPQLTAVVWMGNRDNNQTMPGKPTGADLPAQTWMRFMSAALEGTPAVDFPEPDWDGLVVERESPKPTPQPTARECDDDEVAVTITPDSSDEAVSGDGDDQDDAGPGVGDEFSDGSKRRPARTCVPATSRSTGEREAGEERTEERDPFTIPNPAHSPRDDEAPTERRRRYRDKDRDEDRRTILIPMPR